MDVCILFSNKMILVAVTFFISNVSLITDTEISETCLTGLRKVGDFFGHLI